MKAKTGLGLILAAMLALFLLPAAALADDELTVTGGTIDEDYVYSTFDGARRVIILTGTPLTISGRPSAASVVIKEGVEANLTLDNATIHASKGAAIHTYSGAQLNLTVVGENTLIGTTVYAGLNAGSGQKLVITAESTGTLNVTGGDSGGAGIGGDIEQDGGTIIIRGGTVIATGGENGGAGIGGGYNGASGGTVHATGGGYDEGIGGGDGGGNITINGGTVNAKGGAYGAGIGGWNITINGGTVTATGGEYGGAGIGGGYVSWNIRKGCLALLLC